MENNSWVLRGEVEKGKVEIDALGSRGREAAGPGRLASISAALSRSRVPGKRAMHHTHPARFGKGLLRLGGQGCFTLWCPIEGLPLSSPTNTGSAGGLR